MWFDLFGFYDISTCSYIYIKYMWFDLVGFYDISTIVGYLMLNPVHAYILNICDLILLCFNHISTIVGSFISNPLYTCYIYLLPI